MSTPSGAHRTTIVFIRHTSTRHVLCTCGWVGPQRATIELLADDALVHEGSDHIVTINAKKIDGIKRMAGHDYLGPTLDPKLPNDSCSICGGPRSEHPR